MTQEREKLEALRGTGGAGGEKKKKERKEVWGERKVGDFANSAPGSGGAIKAKL